MELLLSQIIMEGMEALENVTAMGSAGVCCVRELQLLRGNSAQAEAEQIPPALGWLEQPQRTEGEKP